MDPTILMLAYERIKADHQAAREAANAQGQEGTGTDVTATRALQPKDSTERGDDKHRRDTKVVHCDNKPPGTHYDVYIGRGYQGDTHRFGQECIWGNPFTIQRKGTSVTPEEREDVVKRHRDWLHAPEQEGLRELARVQLRGKTLGCWCPQPGPCHGHNLVEVADGAEPEPAGANTEGDDTLAGETAQNHKGKIASRTRGAKASGKEEAGGAPAGPTSGQPSGDGQARRAKTAASLALLYNAADARNGPPSKATRSGGRGTETNAARDFLDAFPYESEGDAAQYHSAPPNDAYRVFPTHLPKPAGKTPAYKALPMPKGGTPEILTGDHADWARIQKSGCQALYSKFQSRPAAIAYILQTLRNEGPPEGLCLNCLTMHRGKAECPDALRDLQGLMDACNSLPPGDKRSFNADPCQICGQVHPPRHDICRRLPELPASLQ